VNRTARAAKAFPYGVTERACTHVRGVRVSRGRNRIGKKMNTVAKRGNATIIKNGIRKGALFFFVLVVLT